MFSSPFYFIIFLIDLFEDRRDKPRRILDP